MESFGIFSRAAKKVLAKRKIDNMTISAMDEILADHAVHIHFMTTFNVWRAFCSAYYNGIIEKELAKSTLSGGFRFFCSQYGEYIKANLDRNAESYFWKMDAEWNK